MYIQILWIPLRLPTAAAAAAAAGFYMDGEGERLVKM